MGLFRVGSHSRLRKVKKKKKEKEKEICNQSVGHNVKQNIMSYKGNNVSQKEI